MPLNMHSIITPFLHLVHTMSRGHRLAHQNDVQIWWVVTDPLGAKGSKVTCMTLDSYNCGIVLLQSLWVIEFKGRGHLLVQRVPTQSNSQLPFTVQSILLGIQACIRNTYVQACIIEDTQLIYWEPCPICAIKHMKLCLCIVQAVSLMYVLMGRDVRLN